MSKKISAIDSEWIFTQDIGLQFFSEAPLSSKLGRSEVNSLHAAIRSRALTNQYHWIWFDCWVTSPLSEPQSAI